MKLMKLSFATHAIHSVGSLTFPTLPQVPKHGGRLYHVSHLMEACATNLIKLPQALKAEFIAGLSQASEGREATD